MYTYTHAHTHMYIYIYIYVYMLEKERFNMSWIWLDIVRWHEIANLMGPLGPEPRIWNSLGVPWLAESLCGWGSTIKKNERERESEHFPILSSLGPSEFFQKSWGLFQNYGKKTIARIANDIQWQTPVINHPVLGWFVQAMNFIPPWRKPIRSARCMARPNGKSQKIQNWPYDKWVQIDRVFCFVGGRFKT